MDAFVPEESCRFVTSGTGSTVAGFLLSAVEDLGFDCSSDVELDGGRSRDLPESGAPLVPTPVNEAAG